MQPESWIGNQVPLNSFLAYEMDLEIDRRWVTLCAVLSHYTAQTTNPAVLESTGFVNLSEPSIDRSRCCSSAVAIKEWPEKVFVHDNALLAIIATFFSLTKMKTVHPQLSTGTFYLLVTREATEKRTTRRWDIFRWFSLELNCDWGRIGAVVYWRRQD